MSQNNLPDAVWGAKDYFTNMSPKSSVVLHIDRQSVNEVQYLLATPERLAADAEIGRLRSIKEEQAETIEFQVRYEQELCEERAMLRDALRDAKIQLEHLDNFKVTLSSNLVLAKINKALQSNPTQEQEAKPE